MLSELCAHRSTRCAMVGKKSQMSSRSASGMSSRTQTRTIDTARASGQYADQPIMDSSDLNIARSLDAELEEAA